MNHIENNRISRRDFNKILPLSLLAISQACRSDSSELATPPPEIISLPATLEMPLGGTFSIETVETKLPRPPLKLNKTLTMYILPDDWLKPLPTGGFSLVSNHVYQSLSPEERETYKDGLTRTFYDANTGIPKNVMIYLATGRYLREAQIGNSMIVKNDFLPEGIIVNPIIALNATVYHEVRYHALLRNSDYRQLNEAGIREEERNAQKGEGEWVKSLAYRGSLVGNNQLFLIPY